MDNKVISAKILGMMYDVEIWNKGKFLAIASVTTCDLICNDFEKDFEYVFIHKEDKHIYDTAISVYRGK